MSRAFALRSLTLAVGLGLVASAVRADDPPMPPLEAPGYSAVYKLSSRSKALATDDWTFTYDDTVTISVLNKQSRWDFKSDGRSSITDAVSRYTTQFGGKLPPNTATRSQTTFTLIGWEFGMATIEKATPAKPKIVGTATIAGQECTRVQFVSTQFGKPEFCVTKTGITLRFANASSTAEAVYEAQSVDEKVPPAERFAVPAGYKVEERSSTVKRELKF